jgi:excisionase family DNA binding protein
MTFTGLSRAATYRLLKENEMPHKKEGRAFLIPRAALIEWVNGWGK